MKPWLSTFAVVALGCSSGGPLETTALPITLASPLRDGGALPGFGCAGRSGNRVILEFDASEGPLFCIAVVMQRAPGRSFFELQPPSGWSITEARAGPLCEMELPSGALDPARSVPVDGAWGTIEFDFEILGIPRQYLASPDTAFRVGGTLFTVLEPRFYGLWGDCVVQ